jgi:hypothetical protein
MVSRSSFPELSRAFPSRASAKALAIGNIGPGLFMRLTLTEIPKAPRKFIFGDGIFIRAPLAPSISTTDIQFKISYVLG